MKAAIPARKNRIEPSWLTATTHHAELMDVHPDVTSTHVEHREMTGREEADATEDVGEPDPSVGLAGSEPFGEGRHEADREQQRSDEQHDRAQPVAPLWLVASTTASGPLRRGARPGWR